GDGGERRHHHSHRPHRLPLTPLLMPPPAQRRLFGPRPAPMRSALATPEPLAPLVLIGRALRRHGWLLLLTLAGCGGAAAVAARALQPVYQAGAAVELTVPAPVMQF